MYKSLLKSLELEFKKNNQLLFIIKLYLFLDKKKIFYLLIIQYRYYCTGCVFYLSKPKYNSILVTIKLHLYIGIYLQ